MLPIFPVHETTTYSTTAVLDLRMENSPYFHVHKTTTIDYYDTRSEKRQDLYIHMTVNQEKFSQKELTNSLTKKVTFTWQREDTVHPTDLSTLQSGQPRVLPPLQT